MVICKLPWMKEFHLRNNIFFKSNCRCINLFDFKHFQQMWVVMKVLFSWVSYVFLVQHGCMCVHMKSGYWSHVRYLIILSNMCLYCNAIPYKILIHFSKFIRHLSLKIANILHAGHSMWHWVTWLSLLYIVFQTKYNSKKYLLFILYRFEFFICY